jgi:methionyl-tRNA synthetase
MLMALKRPLPRQVFAHGWWTVDGQKMSKSKGNFIDPRDITAEFGVDAFRYFLLREMPFGNDGDFSRQALKRRYNAELANDLGNLVSRTVEMVDKFIGGVLPEKPVKDKDFFFQEVAKKTGLVQERMEALDFSGALGIIWGVVSQLNTRINDQAPWKVAKTEPERVKIILFDLVWSIRIATSWIEPFMPQTAAKIQSQLGVRQFSESNGPIQKGPPLFPRKP